MEDGREKIDLAHDHSPPIRNDLTLLQLAGVRLATGTINRSTGAQWRMGKGESEKENHGRME